MLMSRSQNKDQKKYESNYHAACDTPANKEMIWAWIDGSLQIRDHGSHYDHWEKDKLNNTYRGVYCEGDNTVRVIVPRRTSDYRTFTEDNIPGLIMRNLTRHFGEDSNMRVY
jgi:hypothetical protein